jgi:hypothetical protein
MAQVVKRLNSKREALSSIPDTVKINKQIKFWGESSHQDHQRRRNKFSCEVAIL